MIELIEVSFKRKKENEEEECEGKESLHLLLPSINYDVRTILLKRS